MASWPTVDISTLPTSSFKVHLACCRNQLRADTRIVHEQACRHNHKVHHSLTLCTGTHPPVDWTRVLCVHWSPSMGDQATSADTLIYFSSTESLFQRRSISISREWLIARPTGRPPGARYSDHILPKPDGVLVDPTRNLARLLRPSIQSRDHAMRMGNSGI